MATWESRIYADETYVSGGAENYSIVNVVFQIRRMDYSMIGHNNYGSAYYSISCDGQSSGNKYFSFNWGGTSAGTWWTVGSHSFTIYHNSDGAKSISFSGYYSTGISPSSFRASGSKTLTKIARYPSITSFKVDSTTQTSASISWNADSSCDAVQYSLNNGSWTNTSGTEFSISNLSPGTKYNVKIKVRRTDSKLWKESGTASFSTKPIASISNSILLDIGGSLNLTFANYNNNASFLRLFQKNTSGSWVKIAETSNIKASSYSWNLSSYAGTMYQNTPTSNRSDIKVECGVSLNNKEYKNTYTGYANVKNSNPTFSDFSFINTDSASTVVLGSNTEFLTYLGNLKATISTKATPKNYATISYYNIAVTIGGSSIVKKLNESSSSLTTQFDTFTSSGTYKISVEAVDSRGNMSNVVTKSFVVYPYHYPTATISANRLNGFEKETTVIITSFLSRIVKGTSNKNKLESLRYRYREQNGAWSSYNTISPTVADSGNDIKISYSNTKFLSLLTNKSYELEFLIKDKIKEVPFLVTVGQGVPIMSVLDNGKILIGEVPNDANLSKPNNLIVGTDILARDVDGKQKEIFKELKKVVISSASEPSEQFEGGLWFKIE